MRWSTLLNVVDCHAEGEVGKVVTGGIGDVPGETMFDKRLFLERHRDDIRKLLLFEPRGAPNHNANIILPSRNPAAQMGYVILESTEYPPMSGSNTICVATVLLETGILPMVEPVTELVLEAPAGLIRVRCDCADGKVRRVRFTNQPSFVHHVQAPIELAGIGTLTVDVAYGGMTYVLADAAALGFALVPDEARDICGIGQRIKAAADEQLTAVHPENGLIAGVTMAEITGPLHRTAEGVRARNAVVVSPGRLDRSPCGTGTCARLAVMHARGLIGPNEMFVHESVIGSRFESVIEELATVGPFPAVVASVAGQAWITGLHQVGLDPSDPYPRGFTLADTWQEVRSAAAGEPVLGAG
ncbi:MAG: proline racemase family protein [Acetobacteraceae bacterium]